MTDPKVAICIPSGRTWEAEMAMSLVNVVRSTEVETSLQWMMGSQITFQRNELVRHSLKWSATHLFWLDSDMVVPPSVIGELLRHDKDVVGATYLRKVAPYGLIGQIGQAEGRLKPATLMPGGCMLVRAEVYNKLPWPWYYEEQIEGVLQSEDFGFCKKATANGYEIWCDINLSQRVAHVGSQSVIMQLREGHPDRVERQS